ncbi:unnamed protein product [Acanthoscelides obtectus]|uniref:Uncharacterized protein n=1 Tax=Acanthoscelides obtectus TaxID=200917 RepID=A0A9P0KCK0_ACAOB|nr:unnamed protein product [Acanthoscelides obtectus]CAK1646761.1 hypothetical protein AOBTE_LOCUS14856 [Acanthoscelides obtectus]
MESYCEEPPFTLFQLCFVAALQTFRSRFCWKPTLPFDKKT